MTWWYVLDRILLLRLQQFCHWAQRQFGISATWWCEVTLAASILSVILSPPSGKLVFAFLDGGISVISMLFLPYVRRRTNQLGEMGIKPWTPGMAWSHLVSLTMVCLCAHHSWANKDFWFECIALNGLFMTCSDLPPGKSRVRLALEKMTTVLRPAAEGVP